MKYKITGSAYRVRSTPKNTWKKMIEVETGKRRHFAYGTLQYDLLSMNRSNEALKHVFYLKDNPVPSIDFDFTKDNTILFVKCPQDWRKTKKWEQVTSLEYMLNGKYWICKTYKFGWSRLKNCKIKQNGVETNKEQPRV